MYRKLRAKQLKAARMLAEGRTGAEIAEALNLCQHTLSRWKKLPLFVNEIERVMDDEHEAVRVRFRRIAEKSISVIWSEMEDRSCDSKRVHAALGVLRLLGFERIAEPETRIFPVTKPLQPRAWDSCFNTASTSAMEAWTPSAASEVTP